MRSRIPDLSAGRRRRSSRTLRRPPPGFSRNKSLLAAEEEPRVPLLLLRDMSLCYRLLRHLVPGLPPGRAASRVEILQHVIDYILHLQTELDSCPARDPAEPQRGELHRRDRQQQLLQRPQSGQSPAVNIQSCQVVAGGRSDTSGGFSLTETRLFHLDLASDPHQSLSLLNGSSEGR